MKQAFNAGEMYSTMTHWDGKENGRATRHSTNIWVRCILWNSQSRNGLGKPSTRTVSQLPLPGVAPREFGVQSFQDQGFIEAPLRGD